MLHVVTFMIYLADKFLLESEIVSQIFRFSISWLVEEYIYLFWCTWEHA